MTIWSQTEVLEKWCGKRRKFLINTKGCKFIYQETDKIYEDESMFHHPRNYI